MFVILVYKLPEAICEECFQLYMKPHMHHVFNVCKLAWSKKTVIRRGKIWTVCWVREMYEFQFSNINSCCCHTRLNIITMQNNSICQQCSAFIANSGFQLLYKHSTIPCATNCLSTFLVVLKDGPTEVHSDASMFHCMWQNVVGKPLLLHSITAKIACTFPTVPVCAHL